MSFCSVWNTAENIIQHVINIHNLLISQLYTWKTFSHVNREALSLLFCRSVPPSLLPSLCSLSPRAVERFCTQERKREREREREESWRQRQRICVLQLRARVWLCVSALVKVWVRAWERERSRRLAERDSADLSVAFMSRFCPEDLTSASLSEKQPEKQTKKKISEYPRAALCETVRATTLLLLLQKAGLMEDWRREWLNFLICV